ncbi:hypothetical protein MHYP_G00131390 [Metynnis hypsauchen]
MPPSISQSQRLISSPIQPTLIIVAMITAGTQSAELEAFPHSLGSRKENTHSSDSHTQTRASPATPDCPQYLAMQTQTLQRRDITIIPETNSLFLLSASMGGTSTFLKQDRRLAAPHFPSLLTKSRVRLWVCYEFLRMVLL